MNTTTLNNHNNNVKIDSSYYGSVYDSRYRLKHKPLGSPRSGQFCLESRQDASEGLQTTCSDGSLTAILLSSTVSNAYCQRQNTNQQRSWYNSSTKRIRKTKYSTRILWSQIWQELFTRLWEWFCFILRYRIKFSIDMFQQQYWSRQCQIRFVLHRWSDSIHASRPTIFTSM